MLVDKLLSFRSILVILIFCFLPLYIPIMSKHEGRFFPVVVDVEVVEQYADSCPECRLPHVDIYLTFDKVRQCEFINLSWFDADGRRVRIEFEPDGDMEAQTRPTGEQVVGPWRIYGIGSLDSTRAIVEHQCHPFYRTYTPFYP